MTITVKPVAVPPVAVDDAYTVVQDQPLTGNVLGNDVSPNGAPITAAFHCSLTTATTAITAPIAAGSYDLVLTARGHASASTPVTIAPRSALTDPGPIVITIPSGT